jgi:2-polyprenyl-3-methyl-5-hydroxy-6-metoxy-1,4-benzoquinol methylase
MGTIYEPRVREFIERAYWYHTIEICEGLVTRGVYDHRPYLGRYGFPDALIGKTVLDVGTSDGFFAFEFERRGAKMVVAIDTDTYDGTVGHTDISPAKYKDYEKKYARDKAINTEFRDIAEAFGLPAVNRRVIVAKLKNSSVIFRIQSIYDIENKGEKYDLVFCGDLIEHLKHPLAALENLRAATKELCIISLSNSLPIGYFGKWPRRIIRKLIEISRLHAYIVEASEASLYKGNEAGGSFFHFHPYAFEHALLASGFKDIRIYSEFKLRHLLTNLISHHVIFHCWV